MPVSMAPRQILRPVSNTWILLSFLVGLTLNFIPWDNHLFTLQPDFVLLLLLYWCVNQPRKIGISIAFLFGLVMDIADANVFGQHALAYVLTCYLASLLARRLRMQALWQQAAHVLVLVLASLIVMVAVRLIGGAGFVGIGYFLSSLTSALFWPLMSVILQAPQRRAIKSTYESANGS